METIQDVDAAIARLSRRDPQALPTFIVSLVHDDSPIGERVRTFILGDDLTVAVASLKTRIEDLRREQHRYHRHRDGAQVGEGWDYILDAIEALVLPADTAQAFELLVLLVERHGDAVEQRGDYHDTVQTALEHTAGLMVRAAKSLPRSEVVTTLERLMAADSYGAREELVAALNSIASQPVRSNLL